VRSFLSLNVRTIGLVLESEGFEIVVQSEWDPALPTVFGGVRLADLCKETYMERGCGQVRFFGFGRSLASDMERRACVYFCGLGCSP
jgi:hypothetical protein